MKLTSYWLDTAPAFTGTPIAALPAKADVVVIGAGFSGLSAALKLAKSGASVVVIDEERVIGKASGRNGGHVNNGLAGNYGMACDKLGVATAARLYKVLNRAVDTVERIVTENAIDCHFRRCGKLKLASRESHMPSLRADQARIALDVDPDSRLLEANELGDEIGSSRFAGGVLYPHSGQMHMGKFGIGLANSVLKAGGQIFENTPMTALRREGKITRVTTPHGVIDAGAVLLATGTSRHAPSYFRKRIMPVGSFIVATEPLDDATVKSIMPGHRNVVTTQNIHHYFRIAADNRLIFGGRARFSKSRESTDISSGDMLRSALQSVFPQVPDIRIDYCWGGDVDMTIDRLPRAGEWNGVFYTMGYSGHGTQMSVHMGQCMADVIAGNPHANPLENMPWPRIPMYGLAEHFLPAIGMYYRIKDKLM
ncbi:NAD(P)/FAD-dependent oxidoreductase [Komagataeibacter sp. NFXK3]